LYLYSTQSWGFCNAYMELGPVSLGWKFLNLKKCVKTENTGFKNIRTGLKPALDNLAQKRKNKTQKQFGIMAQTCPG